MIRALAPAALALLALAGPAAQARPRPDANPLRPLTQADMLRHNLGSTCTLSIPDHGGTIDLMLWARERVWVRTRAGLQSCRPPRTSGRTPFTRGAFACAGRRMDLSVRWPNGDTPATARLVINDGRRSVVVEGEWGCDA